MDHACWLGRTAAHMLLEIQGAGEQIPFEFSSSSMSLLQSSRQNKIQQQIYYWCSVKGKGEEKKGSCPLFDSFVNQLHDPNSVKVIDNDLSKEWSAENPVLMFCNVTSFCDAQFQCTWSSRYEELMCRAKFVQCVVVILRMRLESSPNLWLHQLVRLQDYRKVGSELLAHLVDVRQKLEQELCQQQMQGCLMEVASFPVILADRKFVQFVTAHNNHSLSGFINIMLDRSKKMSVEEQALSRTEAGDH
ncbi:hypothetical protein PoB_001494400 [Plakobranchus ocellatus]|uniref:Uncharacterized protein n=1 Tax=Plakobranchus ocellatus TaxID=259542 RepID=A0AAV3YZH5_9GAST|nr:hypothetical protein PoB_001494400 [Plakobranchus ocellatus]